MYIARLAKRLGSQSVSYFRHCYMARKIWKTGIAPRLEGVALTTQTLRHAMLKAVVFAAGVDVLTAGRKVLQAANVTCTSLTGESLLTLNRTVSCIPTAAD